MRTILFASSLAFLFACGNDDGGAIGDAGTGGMDGQTGCSVEPTFTSLHDNLFSTTRCAIPGCHVSSNPGGNLSFQAGKQAVHDALLGSTFNADANTQFPMRVMMSDSAMSYLYVKVSEMRPPGGMSGRMPPGAPLDDCEIEAIRTWIDDGAAND